MVTEKAVLGRNNKKSQTGKDSSGFIVITIIPVFLIMLSMITATMGCLSYVTQVMNLRNRLLICDWLLEDENGSMFQEALPNLYEQYKNYIPSNVKISNEKDEALFNLNQIGFAVHELNLYLDVYPDNQEALNLFSNYTRMYNQMLNDYQEKYGALKVNSVNGNSIPFAWVGSSFPWEVR